MVFFFFALFFLAWLVNKIARFGDRSFPGDNMKHTFWIGIFFLAFMGRAFAATAPVNEIIMGFNPTENADVVETNAKLFSDFYKKKTGLNVKTFIATDYTALIEALRSGRIHFAWLPPFSYVKAEEVANAQVLLKSVRRGHAYFYSAIITRADKGYKSLDDLKGKNIAWVDPSSTSGHIFPKANLITRKKIDPDKFFKRQVFAGSHDALVLSVLNGTVDAGATFANDAEGSEGAWTQFLKPEDRSKIKVLFVTEPITGDTMATSKKFITEHKDIVDQTTRIMTAMGDNDEGKAILKALYRIDSMVPAKSQDYDSVRDAAKTLNIN